MPDMFNKVNKIKFKLKYNAYKMNNKCILLYVDLSEDYHKHWSSAHTPTLSHFQQHSPNTSHPQTSSYCLELWIK